MTCGQERDDRRRRMLYSVERAPAGSPPPPCMDISLLWIPATLAAASAQTARNATQRRLIETLGTVGATQVRFLYGLPFAALFLLIVLGVSGERLPGPGSGFFGFI